MNLEGLVCSKSQRRFAFVILKKLLKVLMLLLSVASPNEFRPLQRLLPLQGAMHPEGILREAVQPFHKVALISQLEYNIGACSVLCVQAVQYCGRMMPDVPFEKDINICRKRFAWRKPILGRFEPDWKPFLTSKELFWQDDTPARRQLNDLLHLHRLPFGLNSSVLHAFHTLQLLPQQGMPKSIERLRCRRCVVVGNSNSIRGRGLGAVIDSHNIVIRLNNAPVKEHKEDVGEKTSIRLFFPESALPNPLDNNNNETLMVLIAFKSLDFTWVKEMLLQTKNKTVEGFWRRPPSEWKWNAFHLRILHPYVTYEATYKLLQLEKAGGKYSTTGIIALNLALHICHEVNIIGFGYPDKGDNTTPVHYYDTEHLSQGVFVTHNISAEQAWLLKMMEQGMISDLLRPSSWSWGP